MGVWQNSLFDDFNLFRYKQIVGWPWQNNLFNDISLFRYKLIIGLLGGQGKIACTILTYLGTNGSLSCHGKIAS